MNESKDVMVEEISTELYRLAAKDAASGFGIDLAAVEKLVGEPTPLPQLTALATLGFLSRQEYEFVRQCEEALKDKH